MQYESGIDMVNVFGKLRVTALDKLLLPKTNEVETFYDFLQILKQEMIFLQPFKVNFCLELPCYSTECRLCT